MLQFWIVRAGITEFERQGRVLGTLDVPLHLDATKEIDDIIDQSNGQPISAVYSSQGQSSIETAEQLCRAWGLRYKTSELLQNLDLGLWQGLLFEDVKRKQPKVFRQWQEHPETVCPPEGEMLQSARDRIDIFLSKIYKKYKSGVIVIVVPDPFASILASVLHQTQIKNVLPTGPDRGKSIQIIAPALTNA
jgi:probable phosphoglycerate mutase